MTFNCLAKPFNCGEVNESNISKLDQPCNMVFFLCLPFCNVYVEEEKKNYRFFQPNYYNYYRFFFFTVKFSYIYLCTIENISQFFFFFFFTKSILLFGLFIYLLFFFFFFFFFFFYFATYS